MNIVVIQTTCSSKEEAKKIAKVLIVEKLAACVQLSEIESFYNWNNEFCCDNETLLNIKTIKENSIDVLITHTPITKIFQYKLTTDLEYYTSKDYSLEDDLKEEQELLSEYNDILLKTQKDTLKYWIAGHLHIDALQIINDIKYKVVDIDDFYEIKF